MRDYYEVIGVPPDAGADEIRRACGRLAPRYHPDIRGEDPAEERADDPLPAGAARRTAGGASSESGETVVVAVDRRAPESEIWDDAAIDFPAVDTVLGRMREAFFGREARAETRVSAAIELTPREAFFGADVPLEVPVRAICRRCGGRGEIWMEPCAGCGGSGEAAVRHAVRVTVPPRVTDGARFRFTLAPPLALPTVVEVRVGIR
jgi:molecular chaperone DnaJ